MHSLRMETACALLLALPPLQHGQAPPHQQQLGQPAAPHVLPGARSIQPQHVTTLLAAEQRRHRIVVRRRSHQHMCVWSCRISIYTFWQDVSATIHIATDLHDLRLVAGPEPPHSDGCLLPCFCGSSGNARCQAWLQRNAAPHVLRTTGSCWGHCPGCARNWPSGTAGSGPLQPASEAAHAFGMCCKNTGDGKGESLWEQLQWLLLLPPPNGVQCCRQVSIKGCETAC